MVPELLDRAAFVFLVSVEDLTGKSRHKHIVHARHAVFKVLRLRGMSYPRIGYFMNRDHATIMHGVRRAAYRMERDETYHNKIMRLANYEFASKRALGGAYE